MIGGGFFYPSFAYTYPYYAYSYPPAYYPGGYSAYPYPSYPSYPPPDYEGGDYGQPPDVQTPPAPPQTVPPEPDAEAPPPSNEYGATSNYGLLQLLDVPDGAAVDLDQRPWVTSAGLGDRWLALPAGAHTITIRAAGYVPTERRIDIAGGQQQVLRVGSLRALTGYRED